MPFFIFCSTQLCVLRPFTMMKKKKRKTRLKLLQNKILNAPMRVGLIFVFLVHSCALSVTSSSDIREKPYVGIVMTSYRTTSYFTRQTYHNFSETTNQKQILESIGLKRHKNISWPVEIIRGCINWFIFAAASCFPSHLHLIPYYMFVLVILCFQAQSTWFFFLC